VPIWPPGKTTFPGGHDFATRLQHLANEVRLDLNRQVSFACRQRRMHGSRHHRIQKGSQNPAVHASHRVVVHFLRVQSHGESSVTGIETTNTEQLPKGRFRNDTFAHLILKTAVEDSVSAQVLCLQAVTATAVVTKLVKREAVATSMDSSACGATAEVNCRF